MAGLKEIKSKIRSTARTRTVTKAMEAVSAAKMRKSQNRALGGRSYARAAAAILSRVSGTRELASHPLAQVREVKKALYIVITSDKGLAGALNSGVLRAVQRDIAARGLDSKSVSVIAIGRKAQDFFMARGFAIEAYHPNTDTISSETIDTVVAEAASRYAHGATDDVRIAYQNFVSTFEQRPTLRTVFPLSLSELQKVVADILPARGALAQVQPEPAAISNYTVEPSEVDVLGAIIPKLASVFIYHALLESQASEHSARMVAMKGASDKAGEMQHALQLKFNKARQAAITREVSEITGGMEAMATA
ncbi:MAG: synthase gamma chain [Candidatus Adlerbacteria bacterium]|nr:synthase gamma chain [Candidatus Adlerbacteria bacterium]